jgi:serine/threonine protein kinase
MLSKDPAQRPSAFEVKNHSYIQSMIKILNACHNPTVCYKFEPNPNLIQDILNSLNTGLNLKNEIFSLMLSHMEIGEAEICIVQLIC